MVQSAEILSQSIMTGSPVRYEQPLSERMRTFLRLEYLYDQLLFHIERESQWASRAAVTSLLDIIAILGRGDLRSDIIKELERQIDIFDRYQNIPNVDEERLSRVLRNLQIAPPGTKRRRASILAVGQGERIPEHSQAP